jgi:GAF domain-containing protein
MTTDDQEPAATTAALVARLGDALGAAVAPSTGPQVLQEVVAQVRTVFGAAACSFAQVEPDGGSLRFVAADGAGAAAIVGVRLPISRGIAGWVTMSGEPLRIANVATDSRFARDVAESTDYVPNDILAAPVVDDHGETVGVIEVLDPTIQSADGAQDLVVLGLVGRMLGSIVRLSALYDALGTGLLRTLADPDASGAFDEALHGMADEDDSLGELAEAFRSVAAAGPRAARLARQILRDVAAYTGERR